ncbi:MAG: ABC transporter substrate-binding protein [Chloroflexi bacterium]|nr:ABC transporter substrate-binding protein [Chloroflexota bacterium]MCY4247549.1 ABC transporter substrate-binding protein [Chloroflexota bacterium]
MKRPLLYAALLLALLFPLIANAQDEAAFPVTIENCGFAATFDAPPESGITMNQGATEVMLALGLEERMTGTAYLDDAILPEFADAYETIPVISDTYPSQEVLFGADPDFVYGSYSSAFGEAAAGPREQLAELGIGSYVSPVACADRSLRPEIATIDDVYGEVRDIGAIFGVADRAEALIADLQAELDNISAVLEGVEESMSLFWFDSGGDDVYAGACCGAPGMIMDLLAVENVFADAEGSWATVSWEEVVARDADAIVIVNADWDTAASKIETLTTNPAYADMTAVQNENWVQIDFSYTTPNIRNVAAVRIIAEFLYPELFAELDEAETEQAESDD